MNTTHQSSGHEHGCRIVVDTCSDIAPQVAGALEVDILGFPYILDGVDGRVVAGRKSAREAQVHRGRALLGALVKEL